MDVFGVFVQSFRILNIWEKLTRKGDKDPVDIDGQTPLQFAGGAPLPFAGETPFQLVGEAPLQFAGVK